MDITILKDQIMKNNLSNVYVFTGEELEIQKIYLNQMSKVLGMPITRADSVLSIYGKCTSKSLFGSSKGFYVIRNDFEIQKQEKFYENLSNEIGENVIVLLYEKIDSRLKFGKFFKDSTVQFEKLTPAILAKYIKAKIDLSKESISELSNEVSGSYDLAMLEIDKIQQYAQVTQKGVDESFRILCEDGTIYQPVESTVFDFTDAVATRKNTSFKLGEQLRNDGVSAINVLGTLYNTMKSILLIQVCENSDICNTTGLDNHQVYYNKKYVNKYYDDGELVHAVKLISKTISDIKSGLIEEKYSIDFVLINII